MSTSIDDKKSAFLRARQNIKKCAQCKFVPYLLFLLNGHAKTERACNNQIAAIEVGKKLHTLLGKFYPQPEAIVYVPLKHLYMVAGVCSRLCVRQLVHCAGR